MKIYIHTDLEGPAMVYSFAQTSKKHPNATDELKRQARSLLTGEVNAAVDGILDTDPEAEIVVWDGHGSGGIDIMALHPQVKFLNRAPCTPPYHLDSSYDAVFFVGQHAMAGTENAPLCHTYSSTIIEYYKINGRFVGEFGARTMMAGSLGVPVVFISGDDKAIAEAQELVPQIHAAEVKKGLGLELALHLSHKTACELTRRKAAEAVNDIGNIRPLITEPPYKQEIRMVEGAGIDRFLERGGEKVDDRTVIFTGDNICELCI